MEAITQLPPSGGEMHFSDLLIPRVLCDPEHSQTLSVDQLSWT